MTEPIKPALTPEEWAGLYRRAERGWNVVEVREHGKLDITDRSDDPADESVAIVGPEARHASRKPTRHLTPHANAQLIRWTELADTLLHPPKDPA